VHSIEVVAGGSNAIFTYGLHLQRLLPFPANTIPLPFGNVISGEITPRGDFDFFGFSGVEGDVLSFVISRLAGNADQCVRIIEPDGTALPNVCAASRQQPTGGFRRDVALSSDVRVKKNGTHLLIVSDGGADETFPYNLNVQCFGTCPNQPTSVTSTIAILPQFAFGGGWSSALYFANTSGQTASVQVQFVGDDGKPMAVPSIGSSSKTLTLDPNGTAVIEAGSSGSLTQGYASIVLPDTVVGYGVFRQSVPGRGDQEAVVPLAHESSKSLLIWDETAFVTAAAIVNPSVVDSTVTVTVRGILGEVIGTTSRTLAARTKVAVPLRDLPGLSMMAGKRGSAEFSVSAGSLAVLGLRFGGQAFTSIPTADR
jgi:hypothetical protein